MCLWFHLYVVYVSRSEYLLAVLALASQSGLTKFRTFSQQCPVCIAFWPSRSQGCTFQIAGEHTAFLSFCQVVSPKCNFMTSFHASTQPSDSSLEHLGILNTLLDFSLRSLVLENLVIKISKYLFRGSNAVAIAVAFRENPLRLFISAD